jgi:hypothetical protein
VTLIVWEASLKLVGGSSSVGCWPLVASSVTELVAIRRGKVVQDSGTTRAIRILHGNNLLVVVQVVEDGSEDAPAGVKLVITNKVGLVALQAIKYERLVGLRDLKVGESSSVGQIKLGDNSLHAETRQLGVHLDINTLVGLDTHNKLVSGNILKDTRCNILELDSDLGLLLVKGLSGLHDERHTVPALVFNVGDQRAEGGASRILGNSVVLAVGGLATVKRLAVLANNDVFGLNGRDGAEDADLFVADILSVEGNRSLHSQEGENLKKVVLHNVTDDAELIEVASTALSAERLLESDLDVVDVVSVPCSAEERVTKSKD